MSQVITVSSTDHNDVRSEFSNYGYLIDVAAPGGDSGKLKSTPAEERGFVNVLSLRGEDTEIYYLLNFCKMEIRLIFFKEIVGVISLKTEVKHKSVIHRLCR